MSLLALFRRHPKEENVSETTTTVNAEQPSTPNNVLMRFLTQGGATVELHRARFMTRFDYRGAPYGAEQPYEVDGFKWRCAGCGACGREYDGYHDEGFRDLSDARGDANAHAGKCRSMPRPDGP